MEIIHRQYLIEKERKKEGKNEGKKERKMERDDMGQKMRNSWKQNAKILRP